MPTHIDVLNNMSSVRAALIRRYKWAPHIGDRPEKELITGFVSQIRSAVVAFEPSPGAGRLGPGFPTQASAAGARTRPCATLRLGP
jgi:hypothetical protein